jgi:hypothetical protein
VHQWPRASSLVSHQLYLQIFILLYFRAHCSAETPLHETMMRYPGTHSTSKPSLPVSRQRQNLACAQLLSAIARPELQLPA